MRREIEAAMDSQRNIVPVMLEGFDVGTPAVVSQLIGKLAALKKYNGLDIPMARFFSSEMERLRDKFLNVPVDAVLHSASDSAQQVAIDQHDKAKMALKLQKNQLPVQGARSTPQQFRWLLIGSGAAGVATVVAVVWMLQLPHPPIKQPALTSIGHAIISSHVERAARQASAATQPTPLTLIQQLRILSPDRSAARPAKPLSTLRSAG
jgi:hypothetical protein